MRLSIFIYTSILFISSTTLIANKTEPGDEFKTRNGEIIIYWDKPVKECVASVVWKTGRVQCLIQKTIGGSGAFCNSNSSLCLDDGTYGFFYWKPSFGNASDTYTWKSLIYVGRLKNR